MPDSSLGGGPPFDFRFALASDRQRNATPLRLAILGNFSGQTNAVQRAHSLLTGSFCRVAILALCPLCCGSTTAGPVNSIRQNSAIEALVPTTTKLLFKGSLTDDGVHLQLFRLQGEGVEWSPGRKMGGL